MILVWFGLALLPLVYCLSVVFFAALVRGYTGFGFSALVVSGLTLLLAPTEVVPIVLMMEVLASIGMFPSVWKDIKWRAISLLLSAIVLGVPLGVYGLVSISEGLARAFISIIILLGSLALLKGYAFKGKGNTATTLATGFFAGVVNGLSGAGGLPLVIFFLASKTAAAATRASLVAIFFVLDVYTTSINARAGLITDLSLKRLAILSIPLALGVWLGSRQFIKSSPESFKRFAIYLLIFLASVGLIRLFF